MADKKIRLCPECGGDLFYPEVDGEDVDRLVCECGYEELL